MPEQNLDKGTWVYYRGMHSVLYSVKDEPEDHTLMHVYYVAQS